MLNSLLATMLICLGVANTTPISNYNEEKSNLVLNTPKKANEETPYTLTLNRVNQITGNYSFSEEAKQIDSVLWFNGCADIENLYKITGNNTFLSVKGNIFTTKAQRTEQPSESAVLNYEYSIQQYGEDYQYISTDQTGYLFQIDPYMYNKDTEITIRNQLYIRTGMYGNVSNIYIRKIVYQLQDINMFEWVNKTATSKAMAYECEQFIINIDNGFFYTQETTIKDLESPISTGGIYDDTEITLVPNTTNFIYIIYTPIVYITNYPRTIAAIEGFIDVPSSTPIQITGTNIIPSGTYEVIDIPSLMFEILGMPFAFVSQAFNLTLFPGTPYQVNIANLFLSIFAIMVFTWIITMIIKMKAGG